MTKKAIVDAFEDLRPGEEMEPLEAAARSRSEADWLVGHERDPRRVDPAASGLRRRRFAGARPDADARARGAARGGDPRVQARAVLARRGRLRGRRRAPLLGPLPRRQADRRGARRPGSSRSAATSAARSRSSRRRRSASARSSSTTSPRSSGRRTRRFGFSAKRTLGAAQKLYEQHKAITYPRTNSRWLSSEMIPEIRPTAELVGKNREYAKGAAYVTALKDLPLGRVVNNKQGRGPPRDHPHEVRARPREDGRGREEGLRPRRAGASSRSSIPTPFSSARGSRPPSPSTSSAPAGACCSRRAGARSTGRRSTHRRPARGRLGRRPAAAQARAGRERRHAPRRVAAQGDPAAAAVHRGLAARRDGDRGQGHRGRRSCARR